MNCRQNGVGGEHLGTAKEHLTVSAGGVFATNGDVERQLVVVQAAAGKQLLNVDSCADNSPKILITSAVRQIDRQARDQATPPCTRFKGPANTISRDKRAFSTSANCAGTKR